MILSSDTGSLTQYQSTRTDKGDIIRYKLIARHCKSDVLDIGCGIGELGRYLTSTGNLGYVGLDTSGKVHIQGSVYQLPIRSDSFDTVVLSEILEHLENPKEALSEAVRISKRRVVISVPNPWSLNQLTSVFFRKHNLLEPNHINLFGDNEITRLAFRCGLTVMAIQRFPIPILSSAFYIPILSSFGEFTIYICEKPEAP
jgi:2-polyprenyl-3-methyl-5-hydroxy-6-metoxy-1,4-benzoquinol methylase